MCLAEVGPVLHHRDIKDLRLQLDHYSSSRLVRASGAPYYSYAPYLHLFTRSRSVLGLVPDHLLRPALRAMPGYAQLGEAELGTNTPLYSHIKNLTLNEASRWREHDLAPRLYSFCQKVAFR
jgi:hypothetical protein